MRGLGGDPKLIEHRGVVSREVAIAMAKGALAHSDADLAVAVTGVAGPERDEDGNPVGLVYLACVRRSGDSVCVKQDFGDIGRSKIRYRAASEALTLLAEVASR
jgi:nicotinamide-nucleotide amidase